MIRICNLKKSFGSAFALDIPELDLAAGKFHVIAGHNGSGKTTLLRLINRLDRPDSGRIDHPFSPRDMAMCFQRPYMFSGSVLDNVLFGLRVRKSAGARQSAGNIMARLGLDNMEDRDARTLSSGEMQRVSLARALVLKPGLILLDEPFANIDRESVRRIEEVVLHMGQKGTTVVMVSHRMEEAYHFSANVARLERGRPAPPEIENVFECGLALEAGECCARLAGGLTFAVSGTRTGPARIAVPPSDIILSAKRLESSMRNVFAGKITGLRKMAERIEITADIGRPLKVYITRKSLEEMRLGIGTAIFASFKANAVKIF